MMDNENGNHEQSPEQDILQGDSMIREGISDVRSGTANLFLRKDGNQKLHEGIQRIEEGVAHIRNELDVDDIQSTENGTRMMEGVSEACKAIAILKEGLKNLEANCFAEGVQEITQGISLADNGLNVIEEARKHKHLHKKDEVKSLNDLREHLSSIQKSIQNMNHGLDDIGRDHVSEGVVDVEEAVGAIQAGSKAIQAETDSLPSADTSNIQLIHDGVQDIEEGLKDILAGLHVIKEPGDFEGCPICEGLRLMEEGLVDIQEGIRNIRKGITHLEHAKGHA